MANGELKKLAFWDGYGIGLKQACLGSLAIIVGTIAHLLLTLLAPERAYLALPFAFAAFTPFVIVYARDRATKAIACVLATIALAYGMSLPVEGDYGLWQVMPFVQLLAFGNALGTRLLPWWTFPLTFIASAAVAVNLFAKLPEPAIFPFGFISLWAMLGFVLLPEPGRKPPPPVASRPS